MNRFNSILRSSRLWGIVAAVVIMAAISFAYFYPDAAQGNLLRQPDMIQGMAIGQEAKAFHEATGETTRWTNSLFGGMPTFQISPTYPSDSLFGWINTVMGLGLPSPANLVFMMMAGFFILLLTMRMRWYVALIGAIAYGFSSYFIIIIGAGHIWKFITLAYIPPTIAGLVLIYRGRYLAGGALAALFAMMQISSNHPQMSYYFLFVIVGMVIAWLVRAIRQKQVRRWAIGTGVALVAGTLGVVANLPSLYNTYEYSKQTMRGAHSELTSTADPANTTSGLDRDYITQYSYGVSESFSLLIPNIKGGASAKPVGGNLTGLSLANLDQAQDLIKSGRISTDEMQYLGNVSQYFGEPEGTNGPVYIGALIFAFFLLGCVIVRGPMKWALLILTILSLLLALGRNCMWLTDLMIDYMPMYSKFRTVESILVIAEFTMPLLAVMALQKLITTDASEVWERYRKPVFWTFGITLLICLTALLVPSMFGNVVTDSDRMTDAYMAQYLTSAGADAQTVNYFSLQNPRIYSAIETLRYTLIEADALRSCIIVAAGAAILLLWMRRRLSLAVAAGLIGLVVLGDLYMVNKRYLSSESFVPRRLSMGNLFEPTAADREILADTTMNYRVLNIPEFNRPNPSYHHKAIGGYHAAKLTRYQDMIDRHLSHFLTPDQTDADWNVLNMLNARYVVDHSGRVLFNDEAYGNAWMIDTVSYVSGADAEMDALESMDTRINAVADERFRSILGTSQPAVVGDTIFLTSYAPNRLTYHARSARGGVAALSEIYFPWGWHATIDGKPAEIGRVNYLLRAVNIPAGSHTLEMWFDPDSLHATTTAAYVAIILIYAAVVASVVMLIVRMRRKEE